MKKIGFIDYFLDGWHANNYPIWIKEAKRDYEVSIAWEEISKEGLRNGKDWCKDFNVELAGSIEQLINESDCLIVLAPGNPETHERLADLALQSGKPLYIDKTFAPDLAAAERMFIKADVHGTPLMTSSALRFVPDLQAADLKEKADTAFSLGGGSSFQEYSIHQLEMIVMLMGTEAKRVMQTGTEFSQQLIIDYGNDRRASLSLSPNQGFEIHGHYKNKDSLSIADPGDFWPGFITALLDFFDTGISSVPKEETLEIIKLVEAGICALDTTDEWFELNDFSD
ncbi:MAG: Gfo/Idh/MocA family oxidoreductase [Lentisphaeria bacterium]|nr:Gfo/Idh/MocA family oxidoreductase [Lentisphaeria bacterium]